MITRIAVVPHPPLLVPELTVRARPEIERLRDACLRAAFSLTDACTTWVAVGADRYGPHLLPPRTSGNFSGYGVDVPVDFGDGANARPDPRVPLPALVAGWLRGRAGARQVTVHLLADDSGVQDSSAFGSRLAFDSGSEPVGLLVLADGPRYGSDQATAEECRAVSGRLDEALGTADGEGLLRLDPQLCTRTGLHGRPALQALAGVVAAGGDWQAELRYSEAPFGVGYHVAVWSCAGD